MASIKLAFTGAAFLQEAFNVIIREAEKQKQRGKWYVVSVVRYAEILEWRTPHWRVAIQSIADEIDLDVKQQLDMLNGMIAGGDLNKKTAEKLQRKIKSLIIANGFVKTGNYLGSIAIGPTLEQAIQNSLSQLLDPTTAVVSEPF